MKDRQAWVDNSERLAEWAWKTCVNRADACGAYWLKDGSVKSYTDKIHPVTLDRLVSHFRSTDCNSIIGLHALDTDSCGRWAAVDIDVHDGDETDQYASSKYASHLWSRLRKWRPLISTSNGKGGYHVRILFNDRIPGEILFRFARWMTLGWEQYLERQPEHFPKQAKIEEGKYGNWLRLIGRHHKREYYPEVFDKRGIPVRGADAIAAILERRGIDPSSIPREALEEPSVRTNQQRETAIERGSGEGRPGDEFDRKASWESLLQSWGWKFWSKSGEITYWTRPGKETEPSASLGHVVENGLRLFYPFTTSTGVPANRYYTPFEMYVFWEHRGDFKQAAKALRGLGYGKS